MRRATTVMPHGTWNPSEAESLAVAELTFDERYRRRVVLRDTHGEFLLDLEKPIALKDGDGLLLHGGGIILVKEADEKVADITAPTQADIARIAWHIGNRHTPLQVLEDGGLRFRDDGVLSKMVEGLGGTVTFRDAPFSPEPGAYAAKGGHDHHGHDH
jgi:urease accessory protein